jgi:hypothetical protein
MKLEVQLTPTHSACSIAFGKGVTAGEPGSVQRLMLAVDDIDAARGPHQPRRRGRRVFHLAGGRVPGPYPEGPSYQTYASFSDPDGNGWLLQERWQNQSPLVAKCLAREVSASFSPTRRDKNSSELRGR